MGVSAFFLPLEPDDGPRSTYRIGGTAFNFRDVGLGGAKRLFRSGCPGRTSEEAFRTTIRNHGIGCVVDLRCPDERTEGRAYYEGLDDVEVVPIPFLRTIRAEWLNPVHQDPLSTAKRYLEMIEASGAAPRALFDLLSGCTTPVLIHCAAGRDRTGMAYALILGALGVDQDAIAADYALSHAVVGDGYGALPETILELFGVIEAKWGSLSSLLEHLGVTEELCARLRRHYR